MTRIVVISRHIANSAACALLLVSGVGGAAPVDPSPRAAAAPTTPARSSVLPPLLPFEQAVALAARTVLHAAPLSDQGKTIIVIDPLVDGLTGYQSQATRSIQDRILTVVKAEFPQYEVRKLTPEVLKNQPRVLMGTFTPVNAQMNDSGGDKAFYGFCLVMGDLRTGKVVSKAWVRVRIEEADSTPTAAFADSPVWAVDPNVTAYIVTCQGGTVGDPIRPEYLDGLSTAALVSDAVDAYDEGNYEEALTLYRAALDSPAGAQLRVFNGIYLSLLKLGRSNDADAAFQDLLDFGLRTKRLAVKILFRPGSVRFATDTVEGSYDLWLHQIAARAVANDTCIRVMGHTSPSGAATLNDRLSLQRAKYVQSRLEDYEPSLRNRTSAEGVGSRENLIGTGRDDATDVLDRRVEFRPVRCDSMAAGTSRAEPHG